MIAGPVALAQMIALTEDQMAAVQAQSGVSILIEDYQYDWAVGTLTFLDTDSDRTTDPDAGTIRFNGLQLLNGRIQSDLPLTLDIYTIADPAHPLDGHTFTDFYAPGMDEQMSLSIDSLAVCGQPIGSLGLENLRMPERYLTAGGHDAGLDFQFVFSLTADRFYLAFNPSGASGQFSMNGISIAGGFEDMQDFDLQDSATWDIPWDPSLWQTTGLFSIGNIEEGQPATLDVGPNEMALDLPMSGSVRVENIHLGQRDFGPLALDNVQVHSLTLSIPAN